MPGDEDPGAISPATRLRALEFNRPSPGNLAKWHARSSGQGDKPRSDNPSAPSAIRFVECSLVNYRGMRWFVLPRETLSSKILSKRNPLVILVEHVAHRHPLNEVNGREPEEAIDRSGAGHAELLVFSDRTSEVAEPALFEPQREWNRGALVRILRVPV